MSHSCASKIKRSYFVVHSLQNEKGILIVSVVLIVAFSLTPSVATYTTCFSSASLPAEQARGDSERRRQQDLRRRLFCALPFSEQLVHGRLRELRHLLSQEAAVAEDGQWKQNSVQCGVFGEVQRGRKILRVWHKKLFKVCLVLIPILF